MGLFFSFWSFIGVMNLLQHIGNGALYAKELQKLIQVDVLRSLHIHGSDGLL